MAKLEHDPTPNTTSSPEPLLGFAPVRDLIQSQPAAFIEALGEPLHPIGSNVQLFGDPHARADLLALDPEGVAVVVVVERDGEHWLLEHGLMCAGMVAGWKSEFFFRYPGVAREELQRFLQVPGEQINRKQRVVLVAHSHDYAVFSAAGWLAQRHDIEIWCVRGEIDAASGRLVLSRASEETAGQESRVDVEPLVFPPSPPTAYREQFLERDPGPPHEPALDPITKTAPNLHRLQVLWRPEPELVAAHSIEERVEQIIREEVAQPVEEIHPPRLHSVEAPADQGQAAQPPPAAEEARQDQPKPATGNDGPPVEAGSQAAPTPKPPASEKSTGRKFRLARFFLAGIALVAAALWILSMRTPVPNQQSTSQVAPKPEIHPAAGDQQNPTRGSMEEATEAAPEQPLMFEGSVTDQATGRAIPGARIYYAGQSLSTDDLGKFNLTAVEGEPHFFVKASGYRQTEAAIDSKQPIRLKPIEIRAFYLSHAHVADKARRESILRLIRESSANAVVLGVKDVSGQVNVSVDSKLASEINATSKAASVDLARQVAVWKSEGVYTIGLLTLFKDDLVARRKPEFALRSLQSHQVIKDPDGISWVNPAIAEVRDYNIAVAKAAAAAGFDEIQFDFTRYPAEPLSQEGGGPIEYQRRLETIVDFLRRAKSALAPYNVYLGSSVFGSVCTLQRAGVIGQKIEEFAEQLDYISPMLYPSYFEPGAKYPIPLKHGYQLVYDNLLRAVNRLHGENRRVRPWLQNFPDRSSPGVPLNVDEIHGQMKAVVDARASGWMLWDARNVYHNSSAAVQRLNSKSAESKVKVESITGGALIATSGLDFPPPPSSGTGAKLGVVGLLLLTGFCLAVLYGAARAAWLFRKWTQQGPAMPRTVAVAESRGRGRLARPEWFGGFPQARPR